MDYQCIRNGDEYLILLENQEKMIRLNKVGKILWDLKISQNAAESTMVEVLMNAFQVGEKEASGVVNQFIEILINHQLMERG